MRQPVGSMIRRERGDDADSRLWSAAASGDDAAFETLMSRHAGLLASVARRLLRDADEVQDVLQETFVRAYLARARTPRREDVRSWLLRITVNLCRSRQRAAWWRRVTLAGDARALLADRPGTSGHEESSLLRKELAEALQQLPERLRLPFTLRYLDELSGKEIAVVLGCNESTVWTRIYAARRELRKRLGEVPGWE